MTMRNDSSRSSGSHLDATAAKHAWSETIDRVRHGGERIVLRRHGRDVAALVSVVDLRLLEAMENQIDLEAARAALSEPGRRIAWEQVKAELDRKHAVPKTASKCRATVQRRVR